MFPAGLAYARSGEPRRDAMRFFECQSCGHPLYFEDVPPGIAEAQARWAFSYARMMRKRLSVADVLYFFGFWNDEFVDSVFTQFHDLRGTITNQTTQGSTR